MEKRDRGIKGKDRKRKRGQIGQEQEKKGKDRKGQEQERKRGFKIEENRAALSWGLRIS